MVRIFADYHTHTRYSHGKGTVRENVQAAAHKGLEEIAISDHGPAIFWLGVKSNGAWKAMEQDIEECRKEFPQMKIKQAVEANIMNAQGELDITVQRQKELDMVLAGVHPLAFAGWPHIGAPLLVEHWRSKLGKRQQEQAMNTFTKAVVEAVHRQKIDVITHPGHGVAINTEELARACAKRGTALEINNRIAANLDEFVKKAMPTGVDFCINSDAHSADAVGDLQAGLDLVKRVNLEPERIINARKE